MWRSAACLILCCTSHALRCSDVRGAAPRALAVRAGGEPKSSSVLLVVAAALVDEAHRVLMATRAVDGRNLWEFPGGKVDAGETPEAALARELREELDVVVDAAASFEPVTFASRALGARHLLMPLFLVDAWTGTPRALEGQRSIRYFTADDLDALDAADVVAADVAMLPVVAARLRARVT